MKAILRSVLFVALIVAGTSCASKSGDSTGSGGYPSLGGSGSAAGSSSSGGLGSGGFTETGGVPVLAGTSSVAGSLVGGRTSTEAGSGGASGGVRQSGGEQGIGGVKNTGGALGQGGKQATGGAKSTGGIQSAPSLSGTQSAPSTGGANGTGGAQSFGGAASSGGTQPSGGTQGTEVIRKRTITARGYTFDALETVSPGEPVLLLHGFPDTSLEWTALMPVLAANGYHCLAPDQRGYSPGARPTEVDAYEYEELVADAFAIGSELGERFHLVAHDWGANIAWLMLQKDPSRIASFTTIAVPHYQVWARAVYDDPDMAGYLSMLNTWMTEGKGEAYWTAAQMRSMWKAKPAEQREATIAHMTEPGAMTAALIWYRASRGHKSVIEDFDAWTVSVPTLLIFGSDDIGQGTVTDTAPLMTAPFRVVQPKGGHFVVDEQPKVVADETLAQLRAYPLK